MLKNYMEVYPDKPNWCTLLRDLLCTLGKYRIRFLYIVKQRLCDQFVQNWQGRSEQSSRARFYKNLFSFKLQPYLYTLNCSKYRYD